ncbi:MAG: class I tRNA ligase family protein [bacterium]|nr:class I tRNA ligase family protein [bacterium]
MAEKSERAQREEKILSFWKEHKIFEKSLEKDSPKGEFVFYDGPPFATGLPHYGSLLSSIIKDVIPRYKTMCGFRVRRRWGWDCHGLPIENMVEKELGLKSKKEIEDMGIAKFNHICRDSVLRFADEWKRFIDRIGRFVDYDNSYKTMDNAFIESVWWTLKNIYGKGLLYEGRKVLLYCPHCETPLAKAEIAMDNSYKDVTEESVYIKFKIKDFPNAYFLAWTTTPWTLPGNVALAVGPNIIYVEIKIGNEILVLAKERLSMMSEPYEIIAEHKGSEMVGMSYESLYEISAVKESRKKVWYVASGNFVNIEEGTGIVHTAVLYGEDDYSLGLKLDLPMVPLLDSSAHFNEQSPNFIQGQYFKKAEKAIKEDLAERGLLFKRESYTHSYPHCHRCGTALLYNALSSWFINIQQVKGRMIELNEHINWIPEHLKHGRFLNIVENAPDWTISRNRYWASPLPIWKDEGRKVYVIGSIKELKKYTKKSGNKYFVMRHGEAENNILKVADDGNGRGYSLTDKGKTQVQVSAGNLQKERIDIIISSPILRAKETATLVAQTLGVSDIIHDERLREYGFGIYDGKPLEDYEKEFPNTPVIFEQPPKGGETENQVRRRVGELLYELEQKYQNKNILLVSHGDPTWMLLTVACGANAEEAIHILEKEYPKTGEVRKLDFVPLPHNENFELDLHRPYIDEVELIAEDGKSLKRIPEVIDGWVESGSMPFAEYHYPFENEKEFKRHFPGDFIAEYIAQTRTWFYYMHAVATILFDNISFRNVVTTGTILAEDGSKMSKSKGNYTDPLINLDLFGADALRYYLMSSVVMQAEDIRFINDEVRQVHNQVLNIIWNSFKFYELYADDKYYNEPRRSTHVLDRWILRRLDELIKIVTEGMNTYDTVRATRPMKEFISDFSTWYIRRSRDRFKGDNQDDKAFAITTTKHVLLELSKLIAPVMPFIAEDIYQKVKGSNGLESVHLETWPIIDKSFFSFFSKSADKDLIRNMEETRRLTSLALEARSKASIKVRQPLNELIIKNNKLGKEFLDLIQEELNVKAVTVDENLSSEVELDIKLTKELIEEGRVRDAIRAIQDMRKEKGMKPGEKMSYVVPTQDKELFVKHAVEIKKATYIEF